MDENENKELNFESENNEVEVNDINNSELEEEVPTENEVNSSTDIITSGEEENKKEKKSLMPILSIILIGLVIIAVAVLAILASTSPKNSFFRLVNSSLSGVSKNVSKIDKSVWGKIYKIDTSSKLSLDADLLGEIETDNELIREWMGGFESFKLTAHEDIDIANDYGNTTDKITLNDEEVLSGKLLKNKNLVSINIDNVTDGFITVDNDNLDDLWDKLGYNGPNSLDNFSKLLKDISFSKNDINDIGTLFSKFATGFSKAFDDEDFAFGKGTVEYDEGTIDCKTMDMIINATDFNQAIINGLEEISKKEEDLDTLYKVISTISILSGYEPKDREEFGIGFEEMLQQIRDIDTSTDTTGFILRLYYKGNKILKADMLSQDYNTKVLSFTVINNRDSAYYKLSSGMTVYEDKVTTIDKVTTHNISINYLDYETNEIMEGYGSELVIKIDDTNKNEGVISIVEKVKMASNLDEDVKDVEPTVVKDYNIKFSVSGNDNNLEVVLKDGDTSYTSTFTVKALIKEKAQFDNIELKEDETFDVTKKSDEEIMAKKDKIVENWQNNIANNKTNLGRFQIANALYLNNFGLSNYMGF
jgi:hypothetical protein